MVALPAAPRRGSCGATSVSAPRRGARRIRVSQAVPSTYTQNASNFEFVSRARELESKGIGMFNMGSSSSVLMEGSAGFEVEELQRYLKEEGYYTSSYGITGYFGPITKQAVIKWQKANGVLATGNFGGMSRAKYLELQEGKAARSGRRGIFGRRRRSQTKTGQKQQSAPREAKDTKAATEGFDPASARTGTRIAPAPTTAVSARSQPRMQVQVRAQTKAKGQGFKWGTALVVLVTLLVCTQTAQTYLRQKQVREVERARAERERAAQISRWMRTIDADRRA